MLAYSALNHDTTHKSWYSMILDVKSIMELNNFQRLFMLHTSQDDEKLANLLHH